jgi:hypothetical protein
MPRYGLIVFENMAVGINDLGLIVHRSSPCASEPSDSLAVPLGMS